MAVPPPFVINGIPCTIKIDGTGERAVVERVTPNGPEAEVSFVAPYSQRFTVVKGLIGGQVGTGRSIRYMPPMGYPPSPNLRCLSIGDITGIKPFTDGAGWVNYREVIIPAHFAVPTWDATIGLPGGDPSGKAFTTTKFRVSAEVFRPPDGAWFWASGTFNHEPVPGENDTGFVRPRVEITMVRHLMPFVPLEESLEFAGTVNDAPVLIANREFPRGCLLFAGMDTDITSDPGSGQKTYDITFSFLGNYQVEWNEFMNAKGEWALINDAAGGGGDFPYDYVSYEILFGNEF